jgi:hypothetical protein
MATPEQIAAAWATWHVRHKGSIGPGPGFVEAINAALDASPDATEIESLRRENRELRVALDRIVARSRNGELGTSKVIDMRNIAEQALTMEDIHREQLDRPRLKPARALSSERT